MTEHTHSVNFDNYSYDDLLLIATTSKIEHSYLMSRGELIQAIEAECTALLTPPVEPPVVLPPTKEDCKQFVNPERKECKDDIKAHRTQSKTV